jgi:hypothetical protein
VAVYATAKAALNLPIAGSYTPYSDFKPVMNSYVAAKLQQSWDAEVCNKLHGIQPRIVSARACRLPGRDEVIIHRLRIGHTFVPTERGEPTDVYRVSSASYCAAYFN